MNSKVQQLHILQQTLQKYGAQKQQIEEQLADLERALKEILQAEKAYKIVGPIMVAASREELQKELQQKKERLAVRLKAVARQEERVQKSLTEVQEEVVKGLR